MTDSDHHTGCTIGRVHKMCYLTLPTCIITKIEYHTYTVYCSLKFTYNGKSKVLKIVFNLPFSKNSCKECTLGILEACIDLYACMHIVDSGGGAR